MAIHTKKATIMASVVHIVFSAFTNAILTDHVNIPVFVAILVLRTLAVVHKP